MTAPSSSFVFGTQVKISGLTSESGRKLNNRIGTVLGFAEGHDANTDPSELRYAVHILRQPIFMHIRPANLTPVRENCYVVRNTGTISGRGMFATRDIAPGELIIREASLIRDYPKDEMNGVSFSDRLAALKKRTDELKMIIKGELSDSDRLVIMKLAGGCNSNKASALTPEKLRSIANRNVFSDAGIVFCCSLFNHSCCSNATYEYDVADNKQVVYSCRPIKAGEEIFVCYTGDPRPSAERQQSLQSFGFRCNCSLCTHKSASLIDSMLNKFWEIYDAIPSAAEDRKIPSAAKVDKCQALCQEGVAICDRLTQELGLVEATRLKARVYLETFQITFELGVIGDGSVNGTVDKNHPAFALGLKYLRLYLAATETPGCFPPNSNEHQKSLVILRDIEKNPSKYVKYVHTNKFQEKVTGKKLEIHE